jgi:hypothetical protein
MRRILQTSSWQSEGLARPSIVLPLHAGIFIRVVSRLNRLLAGFPLKIWVFIDFFMTNSKSRLLNLRKHRVTVSQGQGQQN